MLTPQELQDRNGSLEKAVFGGYSVGSVEELLDSIHEEYAALYKENSVLKSKMKVLVEKLEEYRQREDSLNRAILAAQKTADDVVADAERKRASMMTEIEMRLRQRQTDLRKELDDAAQEAEAERRAVRQEVELEKFKAEKEKADLRREIESERQRVNMARESAAAFIVEIEDRVQEQLSSLERIKQMDLTPEPSEDEAGTHPEPVSEPPAQKRERAVRKMEPVSESDLSKQIEENISRMLGTADDRENAKKDAGADPMGDTKVVGPV